MKSFYIKAYDTSGVYKGLITSVSNISFSMYINGGLGPLSFTIPSNFDDFDEGGVIDYMNKLEVWVDDKDQAGGVLVYSGFIEEYEPAQIGTKEYIKVDCVGYALMLDKVLYKDGADVTIKHGSANSYDIFEDIIDKYQAIHTDSPIVYTASSVESVGNVVSDDYNALSCLDAINRLQERAGLDIYWYIDATNTAYWRTKPTTATHTFIYGKDIIPRFSTNKSVKDVVSSVLAWNGLEADNDTLISQYYYDSTNDSAYWTRTEKFNDGRIKSSTYMQAIAEAIIDSRKDPNQSLSFDIVDNNLSQYGYDIESIQVGDTFNIRNVTDGTVFSDNLLITSFTYSLDGISIQAEDLRSLTSRSLTKIRRSLDRRAYNDGQPDYSSTDVS